MLMENKTDYHKVEAKDNMKVTTVVDASKSEPKREKAKRVVAVTPVKQKKGLVKRLFGGLFGPDGIRRIGSYVATDIVLPAVKNMLADSLKSGVDMALFGEHRPSSRGYSRSSDVQPAPKTNYAAISRSRTASTTDRGTTNRMGKYVDDYIIGDRMEAIECLDQLTELADRYNSVAVADYYDMIGVRTHFTDNNYGWTIDSIKHASIASVRGGWVIKFPALELLD